MDLLDRQLDVELDAVEDVLEVGLFIYLKLQKNPKTHRTILFTSADKYKIHGEYRSLVKT